ncbi:hypothetical protein QBC35DRAFT_479706 [Podospora australis]|uniref:BRCT domain-containing protein n=1 Tax=Podospora australis TaxID=1536484 RepID=A0AAN6X4B6_9PEZI|nr:hypothetical protein QBC35DRAFT_479706 [Podospora australis]
MTPARQKKPRDLTAREKQMFRKFNIAVVGSLGGVGKGAEQWNDTNLNRWITLRGGRYRKNQVDRNVTHLVCSEKEFKSRSREVQAALKMKRIHIVALEWLEFSMINRMVLPMEEYSFREKLRLQLEKERLEKKQAHGAILAERAVDTSYYRVYQDQLFFQYEVELFRENEEEEEGSRGEKYTLTIYESLALPRLYWFVAKFSKSKHDAQPKYYRANDYPGLFDQEFALFEAFFRIKTGIPWEQRLVVDPGTMDKSFFRYTPPTGGKPVGCVPGEFLPKDEQDAPEQKPLEAPVEQMHAPTQLPTPETTPTKQRITVPD